MTLAVAFAHLLGVLVGCVMPPPGPFVSGCAVLLLLLALAHPTLRRLILASARRRTSASAAISCAVGLCIAGAYVQRQLDLRWPQSREGERVLVTARFVSIPVLEEFGWSVDAEVHGEPRFRVRPSRVRLNWRSPPMRPRVGDRWQLMVQLRSTRAALNPGSPDMERQWFRERIHALGHVVRSPLNRRVESGGVSLDAIRAAVASEIALRVPDRDAAALFAALAVGVTGDVSRTQWSVFNATGTTHLVAISGLHVTLFAWLAMGASRRVWSWVHFLHSRISRDSFAALCGVAAALCYALLAGFSVPTQRTWVMLTAFLISSRIGRAPSSASAFATSLVLVLWLDVLSPLSSGFWLSFGAVGVILLASATRVVRLPLAANPWERRRRGLAEGIRIQMIVALTLAPLTVAWFGGISFASFVVNFVAIPVFTLVLVPLVLLSTVGQYVWSGGADLAWRTALLVHDVSWPLLEAAAQWPWAVLHRSPSSLHIGLAVLAAVAGTLPWPISLRATACVGLMPLIWPSDRDSAPAGGVTITALFVGQSTSVVVRTATHTLVHGVGEQFGSGGSRAARVIVPALTAEHVERIDRLVLPRVNRDSVAGAAELSVALPIVETFTGTAWPGATTKTFACHTAPAWVWNDVRFSFSSASCVMTVTVGDRRILIAGEGHAPADLVSAAADEPIDTVVLPRLTASHEASVHLLRERGLQRVIETAAQRGAGARRTVILARLADAGVHASSVAATGSATTLEVSENGTGRIANVRAGVRWSWRHGPV